MDFKPNLKLTTQQIALVAIFAALYYILSLIAPIRIPTGIGELSISFAALIATIMGLVLGPYLGATSAFLGALVTWALFGTSPADLPFLLSPTLNALVTGLILYKKWKWAFATFGLLIVAFLFTPPVTPLTENWYVALAVLFDKIITVALILPLAFFGKKMSVAYGALFFFLLGFIGNQADNMWGSFAFATPMVYNGIYGFSTEVVRGYFVIAPFLYPAIRIVQAVMVMIIAIPLMHTLKRTNLLWRKDSILYDEKEQSLPKN
jgi:uncharacterized membrane protein